MKLYISVPLILLVLLVGCEVQEPVKSEISTPISATEDIQTEPEIKVIEAEPAEIKVIEKTIRESPDGRLTANSLGEPNQVEPAQIQVIEKEPNKAETIKSQEPQAKPVEKEPNQTQVQAPQEANCFHDKCADILKKYVNQEGMVNYESLKRNKVELKQVLDDFANFDPSRYKSWSRQDKLAFWINAYNVNMLSVLVNNYPIDSTRWLRVFPTWGPFSVRHIDRNIGGIDRQKFIVMSEEFTFQEVRNRFFVSEFDEPRVFLAITQGTFSSPPLRNEPYYGEKLNIQLDEQAERFLSKSNAFLIDREDNTVYLSVLFDSSLYGKYFESKYGTDKRFKQQQAAVRAVLNFITNYVDKDKVSFLQLENYTVEFIKYDWRINDTVL